MLLTIIVPVYNVRDYILCCLKSIWSPEVKAFYEVILVNDGTSDDSMEVASGLISTMSNITVVNQENKGLSCARNVGLDLAKGKYVWFVDSDDWLLPEAVSRVIDVVRRCDGWI